jgi:peroxin-5
MNNKMIDAFNQGIAIDQNDPALLQALAVLHFIKREYEVAVELFTKAGKLEPTNYTLWNRIGASLAHLGRPD